MSFVDQVPSAQRDEVISLLKRGKYHLLLGAGASVDSSDSRGRPLPLSSALTAEIATLSNSKQTGLADAYEVALERDPVALHSHLVSRFTNTEPADWWPSLLTNSWRRIWTLNIDDVVERAYDRLSTGPRLAGVHEWSDQVSSLDGTQLIHLHGRIHPGRDLQLVFSIREYAEAIERRHGWHRAFFDQWTQEPFITIGASLLDEYDLAQATRTRRAPGLVPSLYVTRSVDDSAHEQLQLRGLIGIESTAEMLAAEIEELTREHRQTSYFQWQSTSVDGADVASFSEQFEHLGLNDTTIWKDHDFYRGDTPRWSDIVSRRHAVFGWHDKFLEEVLESLSSTEPVQALHIAYADRFSGRTAGLFSIAALLANRGYPSFLFRAERRINVSVALRVLRGRGATVLILDSIGDFADDVQNLLQSSKDAGVPCIVLALELGARRHIVDTEVAQEFQRPYRGRGTYDWKGLSRADSQKLLDRLKSAGRYGLLQGWSEADQLSFLTGREIFDALSEVEYGVGFQARFQRQVQEIDDQPIRNLILLTAILNLLGYPLPIGLIGATGMDAGRLRDRRVVATVERFLRIEDGHLWTRYRSITLSELKSNVTADETFELLVRFLRSLSPYVTTQTLRRRSFEYRIVKSIMRAKFLRALIPQASVPVLYERLQDVYGNVAQFWEQRSMASEDLSQWSGAVSFAAKAVDLAPRHPWRLTNFGRILMARAYRDRSFVLGSQESWDFYYRGREQLELASVSGDKSALPLLIAFHHTAEMYRRFLFSVDTEGGETMETEIRRLYEQWRANGSLPQTALNQTIHETYAVALRFLAAGELPPDHPERVHVLRQPLARLREEEALIAQGL